MKRKSPTKKTSEDPDTVIMVVTMYTWCNAQIGSTIVLLSCTHIDSTTVLLLCTYNVMHNHIVSTIVMYSYWKPLCDDLQTNLIVLSSYCNAPGAASFSSYSL